MILHKAAHLANTLKVDHSDFTVLLDESVAKVSVSVTKCQWLHHTARIILESIANGLRPSKTTMLPSACPSSRGQSRTCVLRWEKRHLASAAGPKAVLSLQCCRLGSDATGNIIKFIFKGLSVQHNTYIIPSEIYYM